MFRAFKGLCMFVYIATWILGIAWGGYVIISQYKNPPEPTICIVETHHIDKKPYTVVIKNGKLKE